MYRTRYDLTQSQFENQIAQIQHYSDTMQGFIDLTEEEGHLISELYYKQMIDAEEQIIDQLRDERNALINSLADAVAAGKIEQYSEEWYDMKQQINDVSSSIMESNQHLVKFKNEIRQLSWDRFDMGIERIGDFITELDFLYELLGDLDRDFFDKKGYFTQAGNTALALNAMQYDTYLKESKKYAEEIKKIDKDLAKDPDNLDLLERRQELLKAQQDSITSAKQEKEAIIDLVKTGIEKQVQSMNDLIDEYEKIMDADRDQLKYAKEIADAQEEINLLRKQVTSWAGDNSEEGAANRQKTANELRKKEQDLAEKQEDRRLSETKELLSNLVEEYETTLNMRLDDIDKLISDIVDGVNTHGEHIREEIHAAADGAGYTLSDTMNAVMDAKGEDIITAFGTNLETTIEGFAKGEFANQSAKILTVLDGIFAEITKMEGNSDYEALQRFSGEQSNIQAVEKATEIKKTANAEAAAKAAAQKASTAAKTATSTTDAVDKSMQQKYGVALAIIAGSKYGWGSGATRKKNLEAKGFNYEEIQGIIKKLIAEGLVSSSKWMGKYYGITDLNPYAFKNFRTGTRSVKRDDLYWTDEHGKSEAVIRKSDGAMLRSLGKGDTVFSHEMTERLWGMANDPRGFINQFAKPRMNVASGANMIAGEVQASITFNLPGVKNYPEFMTQARNDPKFAQLVQEMTLGRVRGNNSLAKNRVAFA